MKKMEELLKIYYLLLIYLTKIMIGENVMYTIK
jgi:hypothetical protein